MGVKLSTKAIKSASKLHKSSNDKLDFDKDTLLNLFGKEVKPRTMSEINQNRSTAYNISL